MSIAEGLTVSLEAEVSKPNVQGTWFKDDLEILPEVDKRYGVAVEGTIHGLTVFDVAPEDSGEYTLEIGEESTTTALSVLGKN